MLWSNFWFSGHEVKSGRGNLTASALPIRKPLVGRQKELRNESFAGYTYGFVYCLLVGGISPTTKTGLNMGYKIPICPSCGKKLEVIWENEYNTYVFNPKTGRYFDDYGRGEIEIRCPECEADLVDIFEEGTCNYQAERKVKK